MKNQAQFSGRELQVIRLAIWGYTNKGIARILQISIKTVEKHRGRVYSKLKVSSLQHVVIALRYRFGMDVLAEPLPKNGNGKRVILKGNHEFAGKCGSYVGMRDGMPCVRLDDGRHCVVTSVDQMG